MIIYLPVCLLLDCFQQHFNLVQFPHFLLGLGLVEFCGAGTGLDLQADPQFFRNLRKFTGNNLA